MKHILIVLMALCIIAFAAVAFTPYFIVGVATLAGVGLLVLRIAVPVLIICWCIKIVFGRRTI